MATNLLLRMSAPLTRVLSATVICHMCSKLQSSHSRQARLFRTTYICLSSSTSEVPSEAGDARPEETSKNVMRVPKKKSRKRRVLHNRIVRTPPSRDHEGWSEFSQSLGDADTFGTLEPDTVREVVERQGIRASAPYVRNTAKGRSQNTPQNVKSNVDFGEVSQDPKWVEEFGSLAGDHAPELKDIEIEDKDYEDDEDEMKQHLPKLAPRRKHTPNWYGRQIEKLSKEGKIYECVEVLETQMLKDDRVRPNQYVFTVLVGALGRVGYTEKAFEVYNKMKKFGLEPEDATYTALFNACSKSPWREDGLNRATKLREFMSKKEIHPNLTTYKAMVKAFGRCGDLQTAFLLVDEINSLGLRADEEVFAMLLQACLTDKEAGLRYAIEVWRRLQKRKKVYPTIYHYNLLIRTIRDCQIGDPVLAAEQLLAPLATEQPLLQSGDVPDHRADTHFENRTTHKLTYDDVHSENRTNHEFTDDIEIEVEEDAGKPRVFTKIVPQPNTSWWNYKPDEWASLVPTEEPFRDIQTTLTISIFDADVPNILSYKGDFGSVVGLGSLRTKQDRLALFGGLPGILQRMGKDKVQPDIKTFTQLLDLIPSTRDAERDLLAAIKHHQVELDVDILNLIIRRRNMRKDYTGAKDMISLITHHHLTPNVMTYGCLAMGCRRKEEGLQLLADMEKCDCAPSVDIFNILLFQSWMDFEYKLALCQNLARLRIPPNEAVIRTIEKSIAKARAVIVNKEKGRETPGYAKRDSFSEEFDAFMKYYKRWLMSQKLEQEVRPWEQFSRPTPSSDITV